MKRMLDTFSRNLSENKIVDLFRQLTFNGTLLTLVSSPI